MSLAVTGKTDFPWVTIISRIPNYTDYGMVMSAKGYEAVALGVDLCTHCGPVKLAAKHE